MITFLFYIILYYIIYISNLIFNIIRYIYIIYLFTFMSYASDVLLIYDYTFIL
jgi:hypothetical protein